MSKINIIVPSKNRRDCLEKNTLSWLKLTGLDYKIYVEPQDKEKYSGIENIYYLDKNDGGLSYAKEFIKNEVEDGDFIFKIDDDIKGWTDRQKTVGFKQSAVLFKKMLLDIKELLDKYPNIGVVSFPYSFQMYENFDLKKTKRVQTAYIAKKELFSSPVYDVFEDFWVGINARYKNYSVVLYGKNAINLGVKVGGGTGGHQDFNRKEKAEREVVLLKKEFPTIKFRKVDKDWGIEPDLSSIKF